MLTYRHELHVGVAHVDHVAHQLLRHNFVAQALLPGTQVDLVDRDGLFGPVSVGALFHPRLVTPGVVRGRNNRPGSRWELSSTRHRVGLIAALSLRCRDRELVDFALTHTRDEQLPDTCATHRAHWVLRAVPHTEVTDHGDAACVRSPDRKRGAFDRTQLCVVTAKVSTENLPQFLMTSLAD